MDIKKREFRINPPKEPMVSLEAIVRDYKWRWPRDRRDMVWEYCRTADTLIVAIQRACASRGADGKMHNHQTRVAHVARAAFCREIKKESRSIIRILNNSAPCRDNRSDGFDALHDLFDNCRPSGIGPVTLYDVATRVGAYLDIHPTSLYVHAGVRLGLMRLCWAMPERVNDGLGYAIEVYKWPRVPAADLHDFWPEFKGLPPDEVEDLLCTYRDVFSDIEEVVA